MSATVNLGIGFKEPLRDFKSHGSMPRDHEKLSVTIFCFHENLWKPTFISSNVQKHFS